MPLKPLAEYEVLAAQAHGHLCAGQILGLRMALYGVQLLGLDDPAGEGSQAAGELCRNRPLHDGCHRRRDGLPSGEARAEVPRFRQGGGDVLRPAGESRGAGCGAREFEGSARASCIPRLPTGISSRCAPTGKWRTRNCSRSSGCGWRWAPEDLPGHKAPRVVCAQCGEGVSFRREVVRDGRTLCRACAGERYYDPR